MTTIFIEDLGGKWWAAHTEFDTTVTAPTKEEAIAAFTVPHHPRVFELRLHNCMWQWRGWSRRAWSGHYVSRARAIQAALRAAGIDWAFPDVNKWLNGIKPLAEDEPFDYWKDVIEPAARLQIEQERRRFRQEREQAAQRIYRQAQAKPRTSLEKFAAQCDVLFFMQYGKYGWKTPEASGEGFDTMVEAMEDWGAKVFGVNWKAIKELLK